MDVKLCDLVEVATNEIHDWFSHCESRGDAERLAADLIDAIESVSESTADSLD